jgi:hypothetical protein
MTWRRVAEITGTDRKTAKRYARTYEAAARRYGWEGDQPPTCNEPRFCCQVCDAEFTASRADARYCSNACRQDAYRKRKVGADPLSDAQRRRLADLEAIISAVAR